MNNYKEITEWLEQNNMTGAEMDKIWITMYDHNWKIKQLTDIGRNWHDLNLSAIQSLITEYKKIFDKDNVLEEE